VWFAKLPPVFETLLLVPFLLPILRAKFNDRRYWMQLVILLLPFALSYRTVLLACGFAYLYLFLFSDKPKTWMLYASALLSFLSSGVVLSWILISLLCMDRMLFPLRRGFPLFAVVGSGLAASILHKATYFGSAREAQTKNSGIASAIERSTLVVAYEYGQIPRLLVYVTFLSVALWFMMRLVAGLPHTRRLVMFFGACLPGFMFEGLAIMAFIVPFCLALTGAYCSEPLRRPSGLVLSHG
jgi:hypothetical protein